MPGAQGPAGRSVSIWYLLPVARCMGLPMPNCSDGSVLPALATPPCAQGSPRGDGPQVPWAGAQLGAHAKASSKSPIAGFMKISRTANYADIFWLGSLLKML